VLDYVGFNRLYTTLDGEMVEGDCGVRCGKYCCQPGTVKYLLPGEREALLMSGQLKDIQLLPRTYFTSYGPAEGRTGCACESMRNARPFCCRIFPFRPDVQGSEVVGVKKIKEQHFSPCWIEAALPAWTIAATEAWTQVLADRDNLMLFARLGVITEMAARGEKEYSWGGLTQRMAALHQQETEALRATVGLIFSRT
jgi:hypothetical protein